MSGWYPNGQAPDLAMALVLLSHSHPTPKFHIDSLLFPVLGGVEGLSLAVGILFRNH